MPGSRSVLGSEEVSFWIGTDQPVPPTAVAPSETSVKTCVPSGSITPAEVTAVSMARVAPSRAALSIPNGALHLEHRRDSGGLLVWQDGHSTIKINSLTCGSVYYTVTQIDGTRQTKRYWETAKVPLAQESCRAWRTQ